jgi:TatD DNase family protein
MHDCHCHLDLYHDPRIVAASAERARVHTVAVSNLPSAYYAARAHMRPFRYLRLCVGLHPLVANEHTPQERQRFLRAFDETHFVGEVGLDFSRYGKASKEKQIASFRFILGLLRQKPKFVTLHSRRAEATAVELLDEYRVHPVVFHWYSGSLRVLGEIITRGHFVSINHAMIRSKSGQQIINRIPKAQVLTETDGPFIRAEHAPAVPTDIGTIHKYLANLWKIPTSSVEERLDQNLGKCLRMTGASLTECFGQN